MVSSTGRGRCHPRTPRPGLAWAVVRVCLVLFLTTLDALAWTAAPSPSSTPQTGSDVCYYATGSLTLSGEETTPVVGEYHIRDAILDDLPVVSSMMTDNFYRRHSDDHRREDAVQQYHFQQDQLQTLQDELSTVRDRPHRLLVAATGERGLKHNDHPVMGFVHLDHRPPPSNAYLKHCPRPIVTDLMVGSELRRKGIARNLMEQCERIAGQEFGASTLYLRVLEDNHAAIRFYESMGFEDCPDMRETARPDLLMFGKPLPPTPPPPRGALRPKRPPSTKRNAWPVLPPD